MVCVYVCTRVYEIVLLCVPRLGISDLTFAEGRGAIRAEFFIFPRAALVGTPHESWLAGYFSAMAKREGQAAHADRAGWDDEDRTEAARDQTRPDQTSAHQQQHDLTRIHYYYYHYFHYHHYYLYSSWRPRGNCEMGAKEYLHKKKQKKKSG